MSAILYSDTLGVDLQHHPTVQVSDGTVYQSINGVFFVMSAKHAADFTLAGYSRPRDAPSALPYGSPIVASRALIASDFTTAAMPVVGSPGAVVALTCPTCASMGLSATANLSLTMMVAAGAAGVTIAGATSGTTINGTAGTAPASGYPMPLTPGGIYSLEQVLGTGSDSWIVGPYLG